MKAKTQLKSFMTEAVIYRNQSIDSQSKSTDWFLYDNGLRNERVKGSGKKAKVLILIRIKPCRQLHFQS